MKKQIIIAAATLGAIVFGTSTMKAQTTSNEAKTTVNLKLADMISIDEGSIASGGVVDFNYKNTTDYNSDKNVTVPNSLVVTASKTFEVKVKAGGKDFLNGTYTIPVGILHINAVDGGSMKGTPKPVKLTDQFQTLVESAEPGARKTLNIDYSIKAKDAQETLLLANKGTYTQTVTYTAVQQ